MNPLNIARLARCTLPFGEPSHETACAPLALCSRTTSWHACTKACTDAVSGEREMTTSDLRARLADVPKSSVYRHVALLAAAGMLEVVDEQRAHGAVECRYRLQQARAVIDQQTARFDDALNEHRRLFAAAVAGLVSEFSAYLDSDGADPTAD